MFYLLFAPYFSHVSSLLMTGGAIVATIGACKIYYKWSSGSGNIENEIFQWAAGIILLVVSSIVVKVLFGI